MLRFEDIRARDSDRIDRDFLNRRYRLIAESLAALDAGLASVSSATDQLVELGLVRLNEVLGPALATAQAAAENGFLVATSSTALTLTVGLATTLALDEGSGRALFSPTPIVILTRMGSNDPDDWAAFRVSSYNRDNGGLAGEVLAVNGNIGAAEHDDWVVSCSAGLATSILTAATEVSNALALAQQAAMDATAAAATAEQVLASGPVASVNGQTGIVAIGIADIPNLTAQLATKAASSHGHTIAEVSGLQAALDNVDGGTY
ncbi:hypothetical protein [Oricola sp.]|uniref:hypothetical protein n=1 Tax=Oricola sp. TaxID=1979950 RepID=UPI0025D92335|nr:hypothetical protein [Oricola sp.]MCI5078706.1 phage tail repeat domain-containing protein [Oricola sp.]